MSKSSSTPITVCGSPPSESALPRISGSLLSRSCQNAPAEIDDLVAARTVLFRGERAAEDGCAPNRRKKSAETRPAAQLLGKAAVGIVHEAVVERRRQLGDLGLPPEVRELRRRRGREPRALRPVLMKKTMRSASGNGSGRSRTALTTEKIAVLTAMPRVSAATAANAKAGLCTNIRRRMSSRRGTSSRAFRVLAAVWTPPTRRMVGS